MAWLEVVGRGVVGEGAEAAARMHGGGVAPARERQNERAGELHRFGMQLARGSRGVGKCLERRVRGGTGLAGEKRGCAAVYAGDGARPGLL